MFSHRPRFAVLAILQFVSACFAAGPATAPATTRPSDRTWLIQRYDRQFLPQVQQALNRPATNESGGIAWGHSYMLSALVEMLDATRDARYAEAFVKLGRLVADARDDKHNRKDQVRNRVVKGWGSVKYSDNRHYVWAVHTGMIIAPMARFAGIVLRDPALQAGYRADAMFFLQVAVESDAVHDDQFRQGPAPDEGHLFDPFLNKHLPLNQQNALARAWLRLADSTGDPKYLDQAGKLARFLKNRIRTTPDGCYVWEYWPDLESAGTGFEDISHAGINVDFMVLCAQHRIVFDLADVVRIEKTLLTRVLPSPETVFDTLSGAGAKDRYPYAPFFWGRLAGQSLAVRERLIAFARRGAGERTCSPAEALGLSLLVASLPETSASAPAASPAASRPATQPAGGTSH